MRCAVFGCGSDNQSKKNPCPEVKFFTFPKNSELCKKWIHLTGRKDKFIVKNSVLCSKHFVESDYKVNLQHKLLNYRPKCYRGLKDDAIPSQHLPHSQKEKASIDRSERITKKIHKALVSELLQR
uniref:THAP domain-containing protein 1-like n=1 Tax=Diabrotica virgifera virgifera TaxID=50390 RepID=A0A6P7GZ16_DIAVI